MRYYGTLDLLKFQNAKVIDYEDQDDNVVRGVFIPIEDNRVRYRAKYNQATVGLDFRERKPNPDNITHSIKPYVSKKNVTAYKDEFGEIPFLGQMSVASSNVRCIPKQKTLSDVLNEE